jgi:hypothetical protein
MEQKGGMEGACSAHGGDEKCVQNFPGGRNDPKNVGIDGKTVFFLVVYFTVLSQTI